MKVTERGLALIRRFEGFRSDAYRDAAGVWTIGYGHTSMAGPPAVTRGLTLSKQDAEAILAADVATFAKGVAAAVRVPLSDDQFSALVSFAYNVGINALRGSSVLKAVNAGDFAAVPRRLQLWNKAGGRVLPGLVARRAAEAELFFDEGADAVSGAVPDLPQGKPVTQSTTVIAAIISGLAAVAAAGHAGPVVAVLAISIAVASVAWIVHRRRRAAMDDGV